METQANRKILMWVDRDNQVISTKEIPEGVPVHFDSTENIAKLLSKGYKIG